MNVRDQNTRKPFLNRAQARLAPKPPVFESQRMYERSHKRASLTITHNNQTTYQTIHFGYLTGYLTEFSLCFTPCISMTKWNIQLKRESKDRYLKELSKEYNIVTLILSYSDVWVIMDGSFLGLIFRRNLAW